MTNTKRLFSAKRRAEQMKIACNDCFYRRTYDKATDMNAYCPKCGESHLKATTTSLSCRKCGASLTEAFYGSVTILNHANQHPLKCVHCGCAFKYDAPCDRLCNKCRETYEKAEEFHGGMPT